MTTSIGDRIRARIPAGRVRGIAEERDRDIAQRVDLHPGGRIVRARPSTLDETARGAFDHLAEIESPSAFRLILADAHVVGDEPVVLTRGLRALPQSAFACEHVVQNPVMNGRLPFARRLGRAAVFVGPWHGNHFHWVTDHLPRLDLLPLDDDPDLPLLVHSDLTETQIESLELLGVTRDRILPYDHPHIRIREAIWPSLPGRTGNTPLWAAEWLRARFRRDNAGRSRRLYVARGGATRRQLTNEDELIAALSAFGVEPVRPAELSFREQMDVFSEAELVVGGHGAGLTNMLAADGAAVVEVLDPRYVNGCFYALADILGHRYWYLFGKPGERDAFSVDVSLLHRSVEAALAGDEGADSYTRTP